MLFSAQNEKIKYNKKKFMAALFMVGLVNYLGFFLIQTGMMQIAKTFHREDYMPAF